MFTHGHKNRLGPRWDDDIRQKKKSRAFPDLNSRQLLNKQPQAESHGVRESVNPCILQMHLSGVSEIGVSLMACSLRIDSREHCSVCSGMAMKYKPFRRYRSKAANHTVCAKNTTEIAVCKPCMCYENHRKSSMWSVSCELSRIVALGFLGK